MPEPPYVKITVESKKITNIQKDLIYRLFLEERFLQKRNIYQFNVFANNIKLVLSNEYDKLYDVAIQRDHSTIISCLLSHSLVKKDTISKNSQYISIPCCSEKYSSLFREFYSSIMDLNVITTELKIFDVREFSTIIKYPNQFIDDNFEKFCKTSWNGVNIFDNIEIQKPPFKILVKHIGEFDVSQAIKQSEYLTDEQIEELILLENIVL